MPSASQHTEEKDGATVTVWQGLRPTDWFYILRRGLLVKSGVVHASHRTEAVTAAIAEAS